MADLKAADVRKLASLQRVRREVWDKAVAELQAIDDEVESILSGGPSVGQKMRQVERAFLDARSTRYRDKYQWQHATHASMLKTLLRTFTVEEIEERIRRYVASDDPFYVEARHGFLIFGKVINQLAEMPMFDAVDGVPGCTCQPRCVTLKEHTDRKLARARPTA